MKLFHLLLAGVLSAATPIAAQKKCTKGIPCGASCISATLTCHVGTGSATAVAPNPAPQTDANNAALPLVPDTSYIGSKADSVYFLAKCAAAKDLALPNRRYFATWQDAEKAGFKHSRVVGC